jgi:FAD dependent oxidoreductase
MLHDIIIAGGGLAGCSAAVAAAREGLRVLLLERASVLGGNATRSMVGPWQSFHASTPPSKDVHLPPQVIGGIAQEFVDDLIARGACLGHLPDPVGFAGSLTPVDSEALTRYLPEKLAAEGVELRLGESFGAEHLALAGAGAFVIDATGQCAAARLLGAPLRLSPERQPLTWMFSIGPVDAREVRAYQLAHREQFVMHPGFELLRPDFLAVSGFFSLVADARARGAFTVPRDRLLFFSTPRPGEVLVNTTRVPADHPDPLGEGMRQVRELADWLPRNVPGFSAARLIRVADGIGERESARLIGDHELSARDLISGREFPDAVARGCYPIDIHAASGESLATSEINPKGWYDIPLGCLTSAAAPNLAVAGRCISADRAGFASARTLPTAMATGQAAGLYAAAKVKSLEFEPKSCARRTILV